MKKLAEETFRNLEDAVQIKDPDLFEDALNAVSTDQYDQMICSLLADVLLEEWHYRHEDVASALQWIKCPEAVNTLRRRSLMKCPEYLAYDNGEALARKCTWALADIGTEEAKSALSELAHCEIPKVCAYAQKRLDRWNFEMARKL